MEILIPILIIFILPLVMAFLLMFNKLSKMGNVQSADDANNYVDEESFELSESNDVFLYTNTVRIAKPEVNSGTKR